MRQRVSEVQRIDKEILRVQKIVGDKVRESGTTLTDIPWVGALTAERLLAEVGDVRKIKIEGGVRRLRSPLRQGRR